MMDFLETSNIGGKKFFALRAGPFLYQTAWICHFFSTFFTWIFQTFFKFFHNFFQFFPKFFQLFFNFFQLFPELFSNYFNFLISFFNFFATSHWVKSLILVSEPWKTQSLIPVHISHVKFWDCYIWL